MSFKTYPLGDIAKNVSRRFNFDGRDQVYFINTGDILDGEFLVDKKVSSVGLPGQAKKAIKQGDILYSEIRPGNKRHLLVSENCDDYVVSTKFMVLECDRSIVMPEYLYLVLTSHECESEFKIIADSRSGTFPQITFDSVAYYPVQVPSLDEQEKIVTIIYNQVRKAKLNIKTNQTLEQIAQVIFKSWFVDFDPVRAKMAVLEQGGTLEAAERAAMCAISANETAALEQMQHDAPEAYAKLAETAALFPSAMVESELGEIPEGWNVVRTEELAEKIAMGPFGSNIKVSTFVDEGIPIISGHHLKEILVTEGDHNFITSEHADKLKNSNVFGGDIIFTHAGTIGQVSLIPENTSYDRYVISQRQFYLRTDREKASPYFLVYFFRSDYGQHVLLSNASQVGVPSIARPSSHLKSIELVRPSKDLMMMFEIICKSMFSGISSNRRESERLEAIKATLLPKLFNNEIEVV